jgi:signal transduction histidine kinase
LPCRDEVNVAFLHKLKTWQWPLPLMALSLILIGVAALGAWRQPYDGLSLSTSGKITDVTPGGPAARAGLRVGDTVVAVDGALLSETARLYGGKQPGDRVVLTLSGPRGPWQAEIQLESAPLAYSAQWLDVVVMALGLWLIGTVVLALRPASSEARLFFATNQLGSWALSTGLLSLFGLPLAGSFFNICLCWLAPLIVHFHATFPVAWRSARRKVVLGVFYGLALILSLPYAMVSLPRLKFFPTYLFLYNAVRLFIALALIAATALLLNNFRFASPLPVRRRVRLSLFGTSLALMPLVIFSILPDVLGGAPWLPYPLSFSLFLLIPLSYGYAIYRYNLFETDRILNRSLVYISLGLLWAGLYLALVVPLTRLVPAATPFSPLVGALLILLMAGTLPALQRRIQQGVDYLFYGGWYDYQVAVVQFGQALSVILDESSLAELLVQQLPATLRVRAAALLLPGEKDGVSLFCLNQGSARPCATPGKCLGCRIIFASSAAAHDSGQGREIQAARAKPAGAAVTPEVCKNSALEHILRRQNHPLEAERLRRATGQAEVAGGEAALLFNPEINLWQPLVFQGELEGVLLLGPKMADDVYSGDDYYILETLAWQAAATARNVRLVRELRQRLNEIADSKQRLQEAHRRLLVGREEERKRLAREIHEGPVQELIGISYQLREGVRQSEGTPLGEMLTSLRAESLRLVSELRHVCADLRPPALDVLGLAVAIRTHVSDEVRQGPAITLNLQNDQGLLSQGAAISLFRIYQEAVLNAIRHSKADHVTVQLEISAETCTLSIRDNGRGFVRPARLDELVQQRHFGLAGMQERAEALGGCLEVESTPGAGTEIKVQVPVAAQLREGQ